MKRRQFLSLGLIAPLSLGLMRPARAATTADRMSALAARNDCIGTNLQAKIMKRAAGIAPQNRPYIFNGVQDCYGYVRQVWNAILSDGDVHAEDFYPNAYDRARWLSLDGGLPVATAPDPAWRYVSNRNQLLPGDILSTHQGHAWGDQWHGGIYAGKDANGNHMIWDNSGGANGAYYRPYYDPFVWFYGSAHDLLAKQLNLNPANWLLLPGEAQDIGIGGDGSIWVIGRNEGIYRWMGSDWQKVYGGAIRIAVARDGTPWVVNGQGSVYRRLGDSWAQFRGVVAQDIGVGAEGSVWVTAADQGILRWQGGDNWERVSGAAIRIAVAPDGQPWVINQAGNLYRRVGTNWVQLPGSGKDIGIGINGQVWVVGSNDLPHYWNGSGWQAFDGPVSAIAVKPGGLPGVVAPDGRIYLRR